MAKDASDAGNSAWMTKGNPFGGGDLLSTGNDQWQSPGATYGLINAFSPNFARGGDVSGPGYDRAIGTDTDPAMLTPGEAVLTPPAVMSLAERFGSGFLPTLNANPGHALSLLQLSLPEPPQPHYFASGGYVDAPPIAGPIATTPAKAQSVLNVTINTMRLTEGELNRTVRPWFDRLTKESR